MQFKGKLEPRELKDFLPGQVIMIPDRGPSDDGRYGVIKGAFRSYKISGDGSVIIFLSAYERSEYSFILDSVTVTSPWVTDTPIKGKFNISRVIQPLFYNSMPLYIYAVT